MRRIAKYIVVALIVGVLIIAGISALFRGTAAAQAEQAANSGPAAILPITENELAPAAGGLAPTAYTPDNYVQPQYDPFNNKFGDYYEFREDVVNVLDENNTPPTASFSVRSDSRNIADKNSSTTTHPLVFSAGTSRDHESRSNRLRVRWDFENDGEMDTFFSRSKTAEHLYEVAGVYTVALEVLDEDGAISRATEQVVVVENTAPFAYFTYTPTSGTDGQVFSFNTRESDDSQYKNSSLEYRFDWNGDGYFDTPFEGKTSWRHRFGAAGSYHVVMEVRDPGGASSFADAVIEASENRPPVANFEYEVQQTVVTGGEQRNRYLFDASSSSDPDPYFGSGHGLKFRWDFNYTGPNDIQFTTGWRTSSQYSGYYDFDGMKMVRLQVMDAEGTVSEYFRKIEVSS